MSGSTFSGTNGVIESIKNKNWDQEELLLELFMQSSDSNFGGNSDSF